MTRNQRLLQLAETLAHADVPLSLEMKVGSKVENDLGVVAFCFAFSSRNYFETRKLIDTTAEAAGFAVTVEPTPDLVRFQFADHEVDVPGETPALEVVSDA